MMIPISFCLYAHSFWLGFPEKWDGGRCWSKIQNFQRKSIKHTWAERNKECMWKTKTAQWSVTRKCLPSVCRPWTVPVVAGHGVFVWYCCKWRQRGLGLCWKPKLNNTRKKHSESYLSWLSSDGFWGAVLRCKTTMLIDDWAVVH